MARIKRGVTKRRKHKKILKLARGYTLGRSKLYRQAKEAVIHAGVDAYRGRKEKKRQMRALWITQLSAASKSHGLSYSKFINLLKTKNIELDRKILADIAKNDPFTFKEIIKTATS